MLKWLINILYPPVCSICNSIISETSSFYLCEDCLRGINFIENACSICGKSLGLSSLTICSDCSSNRHYFDKGLSAVSYKDGIRDLLISYKFHGHRNVEGTLIELLMTKIRDYEGFDLILGVPVHKKKLSKRGFSQSEELAKGLAKRVGTVYRPNIIKKVKETKSQSSLSKEERLTNLKGAFAIYKKEEIKNKNVLLIDDIYTTGATASECARVLKENGADKVYVLTVASG